jgi:hypothetical protein
MMAEIHPTEIELLEYVEGELDASARGVLATHVEACAACSASVAQLEQARAILRDSPLLELPARADAMLRSLPRQDRDEPGFLGWLRSPRRLVLVLAPAAAAAIVASVVVTGNGGEASREAAQPAPAAEELRAEDAGATADSAAGAEAAPLEETFEESGAPAEPPAAEAPAAEPPALEATGGPLPVATLAGPLEEIQRVLEGAGFTVRIADGAVTVTGAPEAEVQKALEGLPPGDDVPVFVEP